MGLLSLKAEEVRRMKILITREGRTSRLWVDRFSPRHYTELLSDDVSRVSVQQIMSVFVRKTKSALLRINPQQCLLPAQ